MTTIDRPRIQATPIYRTIRIEHIIAHVGRVLGVEFDELSGDGRRARVVLARSIIARLARRLTRLSFPEIARAMGRPTHSTVIAQVQRMEAWMDPESTRTVDLNGEHLTIAELCERIERDLTAMTEAPQ